MLVIGKRSRETRGGSRLDVRALVAFFALAYALSWSWAIPLAAAHLVVRRGEGWPTHYPSLLGPAIAAVVITAWTMGRPGVRDLLARMARWRVPLRWWLAALSPAAFLGLALTAMAAAGKPLPSVADFGRFSGTPAIGLVGVLLLITFVGALGEETGWRGYALPQLQRRFSPLTSSLIIAVLWFGWHLPQFFVIATYRDFGPVQYVGMFLGLTCGAVVLTWLYNRSGGSILLVIVWHGLYNFVSGTQAATGLLAAVVSTLVMIQGVVLIVLELRARRRRSSVLAPA
jgi:membrane protease YdiL (CAAX protease family)